MSTETPETKNPYRLRREDGRRPVMTEPFNLLSHDQLDELVDVDPIRLRDEAFKMRAEIERLLAKLDQPCGSCHPCTNYADETWRAAGRKPPHVYQWDETQAETKRLGIRLEAAEYSMRKALAEVEHSEAANWLNRYFAAAEASQAEQSGGTPDA